MYNVHCTSTVNLHFIDLSIGINMDNNYCDISEFITNAI